MKMSKSKLLYVTLASSLTIFATACGAKKTDSSNQTIKFSQNVPKKAIKKVGTLTYALENESPFTGIFLSEIADTSPDVEAAAPGDESLFSINDQYQIKQKNKIYKNLPKKTNKKVWKLNKSLKKKKPFT